MMSKAQQLIVSGLGLFKRAASVVSAPEAGRYKPDTSESARAAFGSYSPPTSVGWQNSYQPQKPINPNPNFQSGAAALGAYRLDGPQKIKQPNPGYPQFPTRGNSTETPHQKSLREYAEDQQRMSPFLNRQGVLSQRRSVADHSAGRAHEFDTLRKLSERPQNAAIQSLASLFGSADVAHAMAEKQHRDMQDLEPSLRDSWYQVATDPAFWANFNDYNYDTNFAEHVKKQWRKSQKDIRNAADSYRPPPLTDEIRMDVAKNPERFWGNVESNFILPITAGLEGLLRHSGGGMQGPNMQFEGPAWREALADELRRINEGYNADRDRAQTTWNLGTTEPVNSSIDQPNASNIITGNIRELGQKNPNLAAIAGGSYRGGQEALKLAVLTALLGGAGAKPFGVAPKSTLMSHLANRYWPNFWTALDAHRIRSYAGQGITESREAPTQPPRKTPENSYMELRLQE